MTIFDIGVTVGLAVTASGTSWLMYIGVGIPRRRPRPAGGAHAQLAFSGNGTLATSLRASSSTAH